MASYSVEIVSITIFSKDGITDLTKKSDFLSEPFLTRAAVSLTYQESIETIGFNGVLELHFKKSRNKQLLTYLIGGPNSTGVSGSRIKIEYKVGNQSFTINSFIQAVFDHFLKVELQLNDAYPLMLTDPSQMHMVWDEVGVNDLLTLFIKKFTFNTKEEELTAQLLPKDFYRYDRFVVARGASVYEVIKRIADQWRLSIILYVRDHGYEFVAYPKGLYLALNGLHAETPFGLGHEAYELSPRKNIIRTNVRRRYGSRRGFFMRIAPAPNAEGEQTTIEVASKEGTEWTTIAVNGLSIGNEEKYICNLAYLNWLEQFSEGLDGIVETDGSDSIHCSYACGYQSLFDPSDERIQYWHVKSVGIRISEKGLSKTIKLGALLTNSAGVVRDRLQVLTGGGISEQLVAEKISTTVVDGKRTRTAEAYNLEFQNCVNPLIDQYRSYGTVFDRPPDNPTLPPINSEVYDRISKLLPLFVLGQAKAEIISDKTLENLNNFASKKIIESIMFLLNKKALIEGTPIRLVNVEEVINIISQNEDELPPANFNELYLSVISAVQEETNVTTVKEFTGNE